MFIGNNLPKASAHRLPLVLNLWEVVIYKER
jgi:hypothetical protein